MLEVQYATFVQSIFAFLLSLSFQARMPFSAAAFLGSARKGGGGRGER